MTKFQCKRMRNKLKTSIGIVSVSQGRGEIYVLGINIMLFIAQKPTHLLLTPQQHIIITTNSQIFFTSLHFIEEYLTTALRDSQPILVEYSPETSEAAIIGNNSLEIYWTDWEHRVQLRLYISLNCQRIHSMEWEDGWNCYGEFKQYSPRQVRLWSVQNVEEEYQSCFLGRLQFVLGRKNLVEFDHRSRQRQIIQWQKSEGYIKTIHEHKLQLKAFRLKRNLILIQADNILLYIKDRTVHNVLEHEGSLVVTGNVAMWLHLGKINTYSLQEDVIISHGECEAFEGHYYGATVKNNVIMMLFYEFKELKVKMVHLAEEEEENIRYNQEKEKRNKHIENLQSKMNAFKELRKKTNQEEKQNPYSREIHSATTILQGKNIQQALKASIGKFKEEFEKSQEEEKYSFKEAADEALECGGKGTYYLIGSEKESKNAEDCKASGGYQKQASRQQQPEQNLDNNGHSHYITSNHQSLISNSNPHHDIAETPVFKGLDSDLWNYSDNCWIKNQPKADPIIEIVEQIDVQQGQGLFSNHQSFISRSVSREKSDHRQIEAVEENLSSFIQNSRSKVIDYPKRVEVNPNQPTNNRKVLESRDLEQICLNSSPCELHLKSSVLSNASNKSALKKRVLNSSFIESIPMMGSEHILHLQNNLPTLFSEEVTFKNISTNQPRQQGVTNVFEMKIDSQNYHKTPQNEVKKGSSIFEENRSRVIKPVIVPNKQKYTQMLTSIYRKEPERFDGELERAMPEVIKQKEARLFFAEHIRNFNPQMTRDRLLRLYSAVQDTAQSKELMARALCEFKLDEVPSVCLPFTQSFLQLFRKIYPQVYVQDILEPSMRLIEEFISLFFKGDFKDEWVAVEGTKIELKYSRNLLNILLYLNQFFKLNIDQIFEQYTKETLKNDHPEVIQKIMQGNIPNICGIDRKVFESAAEKAVHELLELKITDYTIVEKILPLMQNKAMKQYGELINLSEDFNVSEVMFDIEGLLELPRTKDSLSFMKDVIDRNSCSVLAKIDISSVLKLLGKIKDGRVQNYFNSEGIGIIKLLSTKLMENGYVSDCFTNLSPIASVLKRSYLAALLIRHYGGKYANRLANVKLYTVKDFSSLFSELLKGAKSLKRGDTMPESVPSQFAIKSWPEFNSLCSTLLTFSCWELNYLIYTDIELAAELVDEGLLTKTEFQSCCNVLGYFMSLNNRIFSTKKVEDYPVRFGSQSFPSNSSGELLTVREKAKLKTKKRRSLRQSSRRSREQNLSKSLYEAEEETDPLLFNIKFQVVPTQTIRLLKEYYEQPPVQQFFNALKLVDQQKIGININNVNIYKSLYLLDLNFNYRPLVPFEYFFDKSEAWLKAQEYVNCELNPQNFWNFFILTDILYAHAADVISMLINKLIFFQKNDEWHQSIEGILSQVKVERDFLRQAAKSASNLGLVKIQEVLQKYI